MTRRRVLSEVQLAVQLHAALDERVGACVKPARLIARSRPSHAPPDCRISRAKRLLATTLPANPATSTTPRSGAASLSQVAQTGSTHALPLANLGCLASEAGLPCFRVRGGIRDEAAGVRKQKPGGRRNVWSHFRFGLGAATGSSPRAAVFRGRTLATTSRRASSRCVRERHSERT